MTNVSRIFLCFLASCLTSGSSYLILITPSVIEFITKFRNLMLYKTLIERIICLICFLYSFIPTVLQSYPFLFSFYFFPSSLRKSIENFLLHHPYTLQILFHLYSLD